MAGLGSFEWELLGSKVWRMLHHPELATHGFFFRNSPFLCTGNHGYVGVHTRHLDQVQDAQHQDDGEGLTDMVLLLLATVLVAHVRVVALLLLLPLPLPLLLRCSASAATAGATFAALGAVHLPVPMLGGADASPLTAALIQ